MTIRLTIPGIPKAKQSANFCFAKAKDGRMFSYPKKGVKETETTIRAIIVNQLPNNFQPFTDAVKLTIDFVFPLPKWSKKKIANLKHFYKITRPDLGNLEKLCEDAMNGIIYLDDAQVTSRISKKVFGMKPMIEITVEEI